MEVKLEKKKNKIKQKIKREEIYNRLTHKREIFHLLFFCLQYSLSEKHITSSSTSSIPLHHQIPSAYSPKREKGKRVQNALGVQGRKN